MSIKGNTVGTPMPRSDWAQTDPKKADYIKNKPDLSGIETAQNTANAALPKAGGTMTGSINMGYHRITNLSVPKAGTSEAARILDVENVKTIAEAALPKAGGTMTGDIAMGDKKITGLGTPSDSGDAATKGYVDGKRLSGTVTLTTSGWSGGAQTVDVSGILASDTPHWGVVYGTNKEAQKEAFALVDVLETADGKFTFCCFGDAPAVALNIQWEVNR